MVRRLQFTPKRVVLLTLTILALVAGGYVTWSAANTKLPVEFVQGREQAAALSQRIVEITAAVNDRVQEANEYDLGGKPEIAKALLQEARDRNYEAHLKATELAGELERITASLEGIRSGESQRLAYQAVSLELLLVQEYLAYSESLHQFLTVLSGVLGSTDLSVRKIVDDAIARVNQHGGTINRINQLFVEKMQEFDRSL